MVDNWYTYPIDITRTTTCFNKQFCLCVKKWYIFYVTEVKFIAENWKCVIWHRIILKMIMKIISKFHPNSTLLLLTDNPYTKYPKFLKWKKKTFINRYIIDLIHTAWICESLYPSNCSTSINMSNLKFMRILFFLRLGFEPAPLVRYTTALTTKLPWRG